MMSQPDRRAIKTRDPAQLGADEIRALARWLDWQPESLWYPEFASSGIPLGQILALYHASADAGFKNVDSWYSEEPNAAQDAYDRITRRLAVAQRPMTS